MNPRLRTFMTNTQLRALLPALGVVLTANFPLRTEGIDLLQRYPTQLTAEDYSPERARAGIFSLEDTFQVSQFSLAAGDKFRVETGPADLGIGHCADGA